MKTKKSIAHFCKREQQVLLTTKNIIANQLQPLLVYFIDAKTISYSGRSSLPPSEDLERWDYHFRLLLIFKDGALPEPSDIQLIHQAIDPNCTIEIITITVSSLQHQLNTYNLFYCWLIKCGIVLYEREATLNKITIPEFSARSYAPQVAEWYRLNPDLQLDNACTLNPIPVSTHANNAVSYENDVHLIFKNYRQIHFRISK